MFCEEKLGTDSPSLRSRTITNRSRSQMVRTKLIQPYANVESSFGFGLAGRKCISSEQISLLKRLGIRWYRMVRRTDATGSVFLRWWWTARLVEFSALKQEQIVPYVEAEISNCNICNILRHLVVGLRARRGWGRQCLARFAFQFESCSRISKSLQNQTLNVDLKGGKRRKEGRVEI